MSKDTYYFQHDYDPTSDPKIQAMLGEFGAVGYGLFWRIIEMLHSEESHMLPKKQYVFIALSKQMSTSVEQVSEFVDKCSTVFELLESDSEYIWSDRVMRNIEKRKDISIKRSMAGKKSAESRKTNTDIQQDIASVEQVSTSVEQNPTKERKVKEKKVKEIKRRGIYNIPLPPPQLGEFISFFIENGYSADTGEEAFHRYDADEWKNANGEEIFNWKATVKKVYFRKENKTKLTKYPNYK